jgi:hypothetical protein
LLWLLVACCLLLAACCLLLAAGCWLLAAGCWLLAAGCWLLAADNNTKPHSDPVRETQISSKMLFALKYLVRLFFSALPKPSVKEKS